MIDSLSKICYNMDKSKELTFKRVEKMTKEQKKELQDFLQEEKQNTIATCNDTTQDFLNDFSNYEGEHYIQDVLGEFADSQVDIYYSELSKWGCENSSYVEDAVNEGLVDTKNFDFMRAIQAGQYVCYTGELNDDFTRIIKFACLYYIEQEQADITKDQANEIVEDAEFEDFERFDEIKQYVLDRIEQLNN